MFIPFLAAAAVATTFAALGAMSVKIAVLTLVLKAMPIAFLAVSVVGGETGPVSGGPNLAHSGPR